MRRVQFLRGASATMALTLVGCAQAAQPRANPPAPSATSAPPTSTPRPTEAPPPTATTKPADTPTPLPTAMPTPTPVPTLAAAPTASATASSAHTHVSYSQTGSMKVPRGGQTATLLANGKVLAVGGGVGDNNPIASAELYDPTTGTWTLTGSMRARRSGHSATLLPNGKVLVAGGADRSVELYDPATGKWSPANSMKCGRNGISAIRLRDGRVLVTGGTEDGSAEVYDPSTGKWTDTGRSIRPWASATALLGDGRVLAIDGIPDTSAPNGLVPGAELYDPATGKWAITGSPSNVGPTTLLRDGRVLMVPEGQKPSPELYDPSTGKWTPTGRLNGQQKDHTVTLLSDGKVLVAGGMGFPSKEPENDPKVSPSSELYDPSTGSWTVAGRPANSHLFHTATLLGNGKVLLAGGAIYAPGCAELATCLAE